MSMLRRFRPSVRMLIVAAAGVIIALAWFGAHATMATQRAAAQARAEMEVQSKARLVAEQLRRDLLVVDQTLYIMELEWQRNPTGFDFESWRRRVLALTAMSLQIFIADQHGIIRWSSRPEILGDDVSQRDYFRAKSALPVDDEQMFIGSLTRGLLTRRWQLNLARRLDHPDRSFAGEIVASYDPAAFQRFQHDAALAPHGLLVITAPDGTIDGVGDLALAGTARSLAGTPVFAAMRRSAQGRWTGASPLDGMDRILAFATVPDRDLQVLVGIDRALAMRTTANWDRQVMLFTGLFTALILLMAAVLIWADHAIRGRHAAAIRDRVVLARANVQLEAAEGRERVKAAQLAATLAGMSDGIMMVDAELRLLAWNEHFPEFSGVPADILRPGLPMEDMLRAQARANEFGAVDIEAEVARRMERLRRGGSIGTIERQRPDGRMLEMRRNPLAGGGFVTLYSDVTDRRRAEDRARQVQTMAAIGRLTSGVAHDFNNLLASISGNAEMLLGDVASVPRQSRRVSIILQATGRGAELVRQLLAFARKQTLAPRQVDLNNVLREIGELLRTTVGSLVRTDMALDPALWPALVDPVQIEHVVLNLAINARDAMPAGGLLTITTGNLSLSAFDSADDLPAGDYVVITVADTGTGMTDEVRRNAFEPFFTTKAPGRGSGLGLSQVYGVARQLGGGVRIDSAPGDGTSVRVFLPRAPADLASDQPTQPLPKAVAGEQADDVPSGRTVPASGKPTVLLVDDEDAVRTTVAGMIEESDFSLIAANNGQTALELVRAGVAFDLLLADFGMPDMTGLELAQAVRERRPGVPVVFITGYGENESIDGERWILRKPFSVEAMARMLGDAIGRGQELVATPTAAEPCAGTTAPRLPLLRSGRGRIAQRSG